MARSTVFFDITIGGNNAGRVEMELFDDIVPKTANNFKTLCSSKKYKGCPFHRIIPEFMCQGGDFTRGDGTGGESIYGAKFEDENFKESHKRPYMLSMANCGPNTNGSQFFLTLVQCPWLDGKHVVFGEVKNKEGQAIVKKMEACGTSAGKTNTKVVIADCGVC